MRTEPVGGLVLLAAVVALVWANSPLASSYTALRGAWSALPPGRAGSPAEARFTVAAAGAVARNPAPIRVKGLLDFALCVLRWWFLLMSGSSDGLRRLPRSVTAMTRVTGGADVPIQFDRRVSVS